MAVAFAVKSGRMEIIATDLLQKRNWFLPELRDDLWKVQNDQQLELGMNTSKD
jgi:hypothetical protein